MKSKHTTSGTQGHRELGLFPNPPLFICVMLNESLHSLETYFSCLNNLWICEYHFLITYYPNCLGSFKEMAITSWYGHWLLHEVCILFITVFPFVIHNINLRQGHILPPLDHPPVSSVPYSAFISRVINIPSFWCSLVFISIMTATNIQ